MKRKRVPQRIWDEMTAEQRGAWEDAADGLLTLDALAWEVEGATETNDYDEDGKEIDDEAN